MSDRTHIVIACILGAALLALTVCLVAWRMTGHGPILELDDTPTTWHSGPGDTVEVTP